MNGVINLPRIHMFVTCFEGARIECCQLVD